MSNVLKKKEFEEQLEEFILEYRLQNPQLSNREVHFVLNKLTVKHR